MTAIVSDKEWQVARGKLLDLASKGRDDDELQYPMDWLGRRDEY
jgi:predicted dithiol-disulfide oxidoreductase (DUF899 family)